MKTLTDLLTLALLLNLTKSIRQLPLLLLRGLMHGMLVWLVLLGSVLAVLEYEARTARSDNLEQAQYPDEFLNESKPARIHLSPFNPPNP